MPKRMGAAMKSLAACLMSIVWMAAAFAAPCPTNEYQQTLSQIGFKDTYEDIHSNLSGLDNYAKLDAIFGLPRSVFRAAPPI